MNANQRNLWIGFAGTALLLVGILVYAQFNASSNFDLDLQSWAVSVDQ